MKDTELQAVVTDEQIGREKFDLELARALRDEKQRCNRLEVMLIRSDTRAATLSSVLFFVLFILIICLSLRGTTTILKQGGVPPTKLLT